MKRLVAVLAFISFGAQAAWAAQSEGDRSLERLVHVAKLWGIVAYLHPDVLGRGIDFDSALVRALPKVRSARDTSEYRAAVSALLAELGDPLTQVLSSPPAPAAGDDGAPNPGHRSVGETLVIDLAALGNLPGIAIGMEIHAIATELDKSSAVVFDLRRGGSYWLNQFEADLVPAPLLLPSQRFAQCSGFPAELEGLGEYYCGLVQRATTTLRPTAKFHARRLAFLVRGDGEAIPAIVVALQTAGSAVIVAEGALPEARGGTTWTVDLGEGLRAAVRVSELVGAKGPVSTRADLTIPAAKAPRERDAALEKTIELLAAARPGTAASVSASATSPALPTSIPIAERLASLPPVDDRDRGLDVRQYSVIRAWTIIHLFYPYLHLLGDWEAVLPAYLTRMKTANTSASYAQAMVEMMMNVTDGHTSVSIADQTVAAQVFGGWALPPIKVRRIEGLPVITEIGPTARTAGAALGDVIEEVGGQKVNERLAAARRVTTASNRDILETKLIATMLHGEADTTVDLVVRDVCGRRKQVRLPRDPKLRDELPKGRRPGEAVQILAGGFGYVDLTRLVVGEVDAMFEKLKDTRGIVFDMRGYPNGTAWEIAPRLGQRDQPLAALFRRSLISGFSEEETASGYSFEQRVPPAPPGKWRYQRPTVMLIDDRAISQSEHTGLFFEVANDTCFIGTPSAGANGDVTAFVLPGGLSVGFTGHEVRHGDGRQLQGVGLQPEVTVAPTIAGIAAGRDEVLDAAVRYLGQHLPPEP
jgi:C-terminal processing protease CtpA/Prc